MKLCLTTRYFGKTFFAPDIGEMGENRLKIGFFDFKEKFGHQFSLTLFCNENLCYLVCFCTNPIFGKYLVPKIQAEMF